MREKDLHRDAIELLVKAEQGVLEGKELVSWATQALVVGQDAPALVTLAGLDLDSAPLLSESMPAFRTALAQLGVAVPSNREELLRGHGLEIARQISVGVLTPSRGVARMEREVVSPLNHPRDLMAWCYLDSHLHPDTFADLGGSEWEKVVLELAERTRHLEKTGRQRDEGDKTTGSIF